MFHKLKNTPYKLKKYFSKKINFDTIKNNKNIFLYAGDVPYMAQYKKYTGLSLFQNNYNHIKHNILNPHDLYDNSVDVYQAEDVFEHISLDNLVGIINDIHRILKPKGIFRLSVPDYRCDILDKRCQKDASGKIQFDSGGGGDFVDGKVINGGHLWFPKYEIVKELLDKTNFKKLIFYHYYDENGTPITNPIDYKLGHIQRTPDFDLRVQNPYRPLSIVVDCVK